MIRLIFLAPLIGCQCCAHTPQFLGADSGNAPPNWLVPLIGCLFWRVAGREAGCDWSCLDESVLRSFGLTGKAEATMGLPFSGGQKVLLSRIEKEMIPPSPSP
jgi:hypothetical protein